MNNVNRTLYIPLYGKACVSRKGIILHDPKAEAVWAEEGFALRGKAASKWLAYYMGMRAAVFDRWLKARMDADPEAVVLHLGCGLDSRIHRVGGENRVWYDVDFPDVIAERKRHYAGTDSYRMLGADIRGDWLKDIPGDSAIVVMEGVSMYLSPEELAAVLGGLRKHFDRVSLLMDCYTEFAARASRYKNPINDVGVTQVFGMDDPKAVEVSGMTFRRERDMTPEDLIGQLRGMERAVFRRLYAGAIARKLYRLYEYEAH